MSLELRGHSVGWFLQVDASDTNNDAKSGVESKKVRILFVLKMKMETLALCKEWLQLSFP